MNATHDRNEAAYKRLKDELARRYPEGHFVAFDDGQVVADAASFDELIAALAAIGKDRPDIFVVEAGVDYPEEVYIPPLLIEPREAQDELDQLCEESPVDSNGTRLTRDQLHERR
jgi:hypothetical protein